MNEADEKLAKYLRTRLPSEWKVETFDVPDMTSGINITAPGFLFFRRQLLEVMITFEAIYVSREKATKAEQDKVLSLIKGYTRIPIVLR